MFAQSANGWIFAAGLPGKLVLLCMSDGKFRKSEKVTTGIRRRRLSAKIFPKFALNKTEKLEKTVQRFYPIVLVKSCRGVWNHA